MPVALPTRLQEPGGTILARACTPGLPALPLQHRGAEEDVTCSDVAHLGPGDDRCAFVREHCTDPASLFNYPRLYYCGAAQHGALLPGLMVVRVPAGRGSGGGCGRGSGGA